MPGIRSGRISTSISSCLRWSSAKSSADGGPPVEGLPEQVAALGLLAAQPLGLALGLVGIVVDDGIPEVEGDRLDLVIHERFPLEKTPPRETFAGSAETSLRPP